VDLANNISEDVQKLLFASAVKSIREKFGMDMDSATNILKLG
jgi:hypothetical protein